jgi:streptomycin 6-kinase
VRVQSRLVACCALLGLHNPIFGFSLLTLNSKTVQVPSDLKETIERVYGEQGRQWLATLPTLLLECRQRWSLELERPFENLSYNFVIPARTAQGAAVVLKLGVPCRELQTEAAALDLFEGNGVVRLLDHDVPRGALLIERVLPGAPLGNSRGNAEATRIAATLMQRLWREPPTGHSFPSLALWFEAFARLRQQFNGASGPFPPEIIARAEHTFAELNDSAERAVLLHGDLHHDNILASAVSGWVAIDPKGIVGDPGYEVGTFMLNQLPIGAADLVVCELLDQRLAIFAAELQISRERLAGWAFCQAVLSAVWSFEEAAEWRGTIRLARLLEASQVLCK